MSGFHSQALAIVGSRPPGDPGQMLENAGRLTALAAEFESQASAVAAAAVQGSGVGVRLANAGTRADATMLRAGAAALESAGSTLRAAAGRVQEAQRAWARRVDEVEQRLADDSRRRQEARS